MRCDGAACPRELVIQDRFSIGLINDNECLARGAFAPSHGNPRTHNVSNQILPVAEIMRGQGSVYRLAPSGVDIGSLVTLLESTKPEQKLFALIAVGAAEVREIRYGERRAFCVVDECDSDGQGAKHSAHAHISICSALADTGVDRSDLEFNQAIRDLLTLFRRKDRQVWQAIPQKAAA